jgi:predicted ATPase/DNA-binding SARP family transcriptional activator
MASGGKSQLRVYLFGAPRFERGGKSLSPGRRKVIALLAYLAVTRRPHNRDALAALFWPDYDQSGARANLRRDISRARKAFGDEMLQVDGEQLSLNIDRLVWSDISEFERLLEKVHRHGHNLRADAPVLDEDCANDLTKAVELFQGEFMAGFSLVDSAPFDDWQFFENEGLRQNLAEALQLLIHWHTRSGNFERAIDYARRWLHLDPLHELAHRQLMKLYAWSGQQAAAMRQYDELVKTLKRELGVKPEEETNELFAAIRAREIDIPGDTELRSLQLPDVPIPAASAPSEQPAEKRPKSNLPAAATRFVGRTEEIQHIIQQLLGEPASRILTLLGPGGIGKTRLSIEAARQLAEAHPQAFPDGVWFVPLVPLTDPQEIAPAIAQAIDFSTHSETSPPDQQLIDHLKTKKILLVMDNFEHLVSSSSQAFLSRLLADTPETYLLTSSRVRLNIQGEHILAIEGLRLPPPDYRGEIDPLAYSALGLFQQTAERARPGFTLDEANLPSVLRICSLVQGMPLGIELAATWLEVLKPAEIVAEIERSLDFLESDYYNLPARQRSVRAIFNSSWELLDEAEQHTIKSLTVFTARFTREAGQAVSGASLRAMLGLVHKSWLQRDDQGRFAIHELLRQYAYQKLQEDESVCHQAHLRHATYYADLLIGLNAAMQGSQQQSAFDTVRDEFDNIRTAWNWLVDQNHFELVVHWILPALFRYCESRIRFGELQPLISKALQAIEAHSEEYRDQHTLPILLTVQGAFFTNGYPVRYESYGMVVPAYREAVMRAWELSDLPVEPISKTLEFWEIMLIYLYGRIIDRTAGIQAMNYLIKDYSGLQGRWETAFALLMLGQMHELLISGQAEMELIDGYLLEALNSFIELGDEREAGHTLRSLGNLRHFQGRPQQAIECWTSAQIKLNAVGEWTIATDINRQLGDLYLDIGEFEKAFDCYRTMSQVYLARGHKWLAGLHLSKESYEAARYGDMERAFETRQLSLQYSREAGDIFGEAWSTWELGEYYRLSGEVSPARHNFDRALHLFNLVKDTSGLTFFHRGMGDVALQTGDVQDAESQFKLSYQYSQQVPNPWAQAYAACGLGYVMLMKQDLDEAQQYLDTALPLAQRTGHVAMFLHVLTAAAYLYEAQENYARAIETAAFVEHHYATWKEDKKRAAILLERNRQTLSVEQFDRLVASSRQLQLEDFQIEPEK